jgi:hypothetical protein
MILPPATLRDAPPLRAAEANQTGATHPTVPILIRGGNYGNGQAIAAMN